MKPLISADDLRARPDDGEQTPVSVDAPG